jgi:restriction system protein
MAGEGVELMGVVASERNDGGYFVTTSGFTAGATSFAGANGIRLIDGGELAKLMAQAFGDSDCLEYHALCPQCGERLTFSLYTPETKATCCNGHDVPNDFDNSWFLVGSKEGTPTCKKCGKPMRKVSGRRGAFWGCTGYPACRFTVGIVRKPYGRSRKLERASI